MRSTGRAFLPNFVSIEVIISEMKGVTERQTDGRTVNRVRQGLILHKPLKKKDRQTNFQQNLKEGLIMRPMFLT